MVQQLSNQKDWKAWQGIVYFGVLFVILVFQGFVLEPAFGLIGVLLGQLIFLASAIGVTKLHKTPLKEVFPVSKVSIRDIFGIIVFAIGAIISNLALSGFGMFIFPQDLTQVQGLSDFLYGNGLPAIVIVLIVSVTPAICEEAIMRGAFLSHFRGLKKDWLVCLIVGIAFGVLHLSPIKFLSTGFLGACLAYLVIKKNNIILAAILHLMNNLLSSVSGVMSDPEAASEAAASLTSTNTLSFLGTFVMLGAIAPVLLYLGAVLLKTTKFSGKKFGIAIALSVVMFVAGVALPVIDASNRTVVAFTWSTTVTDEGARADFGIDEAGEYVIQIAGSTQNGGVDYRIEDADGNLITTDSFESGLVTFSQTIELEAGHYSIYASENSDADSAEMTVQVSVLTPQ